MQPKLYNVYIIQADEIPIITLILLHGNHYLSRHLQFSTHYAYIYIRIPQSQCLKYQMRQHITVMRLPITSVFAPLITTQSWRINETVILTAYSSADLNNVHELLYPVDHDHSLNLYSLVTQLSILSGTLMSFNSPVPQPKQPNHPASNTACNHRHWYLSKMTPNTAIQSLFPIGTSHSLRLSPHYTILSLLL